MAPEAEAAEADEEEETEEEQTTTSPLDDAEFLEEQYNGEGLTQAEIAELDVVTDYHDGPVTSSTVSHYMNKHEVKTRGSTVDDERLDDPEWLRNEYLSEEEGGEGEKRTMQDLADDIGCSDGTIMRRLHDNDIPVRRSTVGETKDDEDEAEDAEAEDDDEESGDTEAEGDDEEPEDAEE